MKRILSLIDTKPQLILAIILIATAGVYWGTIHHDFVWDDTSFILEWEELRHPWDNLSGFLHGEVAPRHQGVYRPLRSLFYAASFSLYGTNPTGYHLQALFIHLVSTVLVYLISRQLTKHALIPLLTTLIFGLHPLHIEAVTWITTSFDTIGSALFFASFYVYLRYSKTQKTFLLIISALLATLAFFTYEMTLVLPALIFIYEVFFNHRSLIKPSFLIRSLTPFVLLALFYLFIRFFLLHITGREDYLLGSPLITVQVMTLALVSYFRLLILPLGLSINHTLKAGFSGLFYHDYSPGNPITTPHFTDPDILLALALILAALYFVYHFYKQRPLIAFSSAWFLIALLPVMQIFPQSIIFAEKYTYIASFGTSLLTAMILLLISNKLFPILHLHSKQLFLTLALCYSLFLGYQTYVRNQTWKDAYTLWSTALASSPDSGYIHNNLGLALINRGDQDQAFYHIGKAAQLNPNSEINLTNYGALLVEQGEYDQAITIYQQALTDNPTHLPTLVSLASAYKYLGQYGRAQNLYHQAFDLDPNYQPALINLAKLFIEIGDHDQARTYLDRVLAISSNQAFIYFDIASVYQEQQNYAQAIAAYTKSLQLDASNADAYNSLGNVYFDLGDYFQAITNYQKALDIRPDHPYASKNLQDAQEKLETLPSRDR